MNTDLCAKCKMPLNYCKPHSHSSWEIILCTSGHSTAFIGDKKYTASAGSIMVIPPNTTHSNISDDYFTDMYMSAKKLDFFDIVFTHDIDGNVLVLMNMLHKTLTEKEFHYSNIADNLTETICSYIKKLSKNEHGYPFVNDLKNTIYNNLANTNFDLKKEIDGYGYNPIYLRRCFKKVLGKPPLEYMTELRIQQAKILLIQNTFVSIENVAHSCGFNDSFYFSTCFKKHTGISPMRYRKSYFLNEWFIMAGNKTKKRVTPIWNVPKQVTHSFGKSLIYWYNAPDGAFFDELSFRVRKSSFGVKKISFGVKQPIAHS